jgi:hypothetical protein
VSHSVQRALQRDTSLVIHRVIIALILIGTALLAIGLAGGLGVAGGFGGGAAGLTALGMVAPGGTQPAVQYALPFTAGAHEHVEGPFTTFTVTPTTGVQTINPIDIPAYGYMTGIWIEVSASGGVGGTLGADGPWNLISSIALRDVGGQYIVNPVSGFDMYLINLFSPGNGAMNNNLANYPFYVGSAPNPAFALRVPVEITHRDALGALANQNSAANFKLELAFNSRAGSTTVDYTTPPLLTVKLWYEGWTLPAAQSMRNEPQSQVPPLLGTGLTQSKTSVSSIVGANTFKIEKVGNLIRNIILVGRNSSGVRADACLPDVMSFNWDGNMILQASVRYMQAWVYEKLSGVLTWPVGVVVIPFAHGGQQGEGRLGNEGPDLWFPTTQSSRLEVVGSVATAGTLDKIVSEVAPIEATQPDRYQTPNDTGRLMAPAQ